MTFVYRVAAFVTDRVAPHLVIGKTPRNAVSREQLEQEAAEELAAQIGQGRPGPEEAARPRPVPAWSLPRPTVTRSLDVVRVRVDALVNPPASPASAPARPAAPRRRDLSPKQ